MHEWVHGARFPLADEKPPLARRSGKKLLPMLDIHKNPLLVSILYGCEMLKEMAVKNTMGCEYLKHAHGLLLMKTDKARRGCARCAGRAGAEQAF